MTYARVITPTLTFYPPNSQQQDDQTLNGILNFIKSNMSCNLQYFQTNNRTFVFSIWKNIRFIISGENESIAYLRFRLQMIREIAVFLFGPDFDLIMRNNSINISYIELFAKYVDTFLEMSEEDYKFQLGIISHISFFSEYSHYLSENIPTSQFPHDLPFIDCLIFRNHKIVSRFNFSNPNPIDYLSVILLSIFTKIEYPYINHDEINNKESNDNQEKEKIRDVSFGDFKEVIDNEEQRIKYFDPNYVNITEPASVQIRAGFFTLNGNCQPISISATRLGPNSPYVALFLTQQMNASVKRFIVAGIISLISSTISEAVRLNFKALSLNSPGLVYFLVTNRSSGETFEFETSNDVKSHHITKLLFRTMKKHTFDALFDGQTTFIWRDSHFLFSYSIFFVQNDGKSIALTEKFKIPMFRSDFDVTYNSICNEIFRKDKNVRVFEVYSIFLKAIPPQIAFSENLKLLVEVLKEKKISFAGSIDNFQASLMPSSKKSWTVVV